MTSTSELLAKTCRRTDAALAQQDIDRYLAALDGWALQDGKIEKIFSLSNFHETMALVNAIAYLVHAEDHHPEMLVTYNRCTVRFNTHSVNGGRGGISENDFICAAKVDALFRRTFC